MKMRNTLWSLCVVLLLTLLLAGCGQIAAPAPAADTQNQIAPVIPMSSPEDITPHPIDSTPAPSDTVPAPSDVAPASSDGFPEQPDSEPAPSEEDGIYLLVNGAKLVLGMQYDDVRDALGPQTAPDETLGGCDGSFFGTIHHYPDLNLTENEDGMIRGLEVYGFFEGEGDAALLGKVRLGTPPEEALAALGRPENDGTFAEDRVLNYRREGQYLFVFLDPENGNAVSGISMALSEE